MFMNSTFRPSYLKPNDLISIVSTARKLTPDEVQVACTILESWGLKVKLGRHLFESDRQFAGTDQQRCQDLQEAFDDAEVKAVLCARGGYGTSRFIDDMNFDAFRRNPKWIAGFSDVTVLSSHLLNVLGCESIHSPMAFNLQNTDPRSTEALRQALFGELRSLQWKAKVWFPGEASGQLSGGNLSILYSICGTPSWGSQQDRILFIEDLDEYLYHLDRMMVSLFRSGTLNGIKALIMGALSDMHDNKVAFGMDPEQIIAENVKKYRPDIPVISGMPLGHVPFNHAVYIGRQSKIRLKDDLAILEFAL